MAPRAGGRLGFLDVLRAVAVLFVLFQHVAEQTWPGFSSFTSGGIQLGQLGVTLFFCCSGFIIPVSLERSGNLRRFWIGRFFRLYPLYWLSLLVALLGTRFGSFPADGLRPGDWIANATMFQLWLGRPDAVGLYWSLGWEMSFYVGMSVLFLLHLHRRAVALAVTSVLGCLVVMAALPSVMPGRHLSLGLYNFAFMLTGYVLHQWFVGAVRTRAAAAVFGLTVAGSVGLLWGSAALGVLPTTNAGGSITGPRPMIFAWVLALAIFGVGLLWGRSGGQGVAVLRRLGTISYSVYLLQGLVIALLRPAGWPSWAWALLWTAGTIACAEVTYRFVERPAIALGRRLARRPDAGTPTVS